MENLTPQATNGEQKDFLEEEASNLFEYQYASQGQRFLNWLIDNLLINYAIGYATGFVLGLVLNELAPEFLYRVVAGGTIEFYVFAYGLGTINYLLYYSLSEKLFKGYTLGKLITGTRAIRQDGQELTFKNAFLRSLSRCVPFEVFSGFSSLTWHDSWTDTMVIKAR